MLVYFCYLLGLKTKAAQVIGEKGNERKLESFGGNINVYKGSVYRVGGDGVSPLPGKTRCIWSKIQRDVRAGNWLIGDNSICECCFVSGRGSWLPEWML